MARDEGREEHPITKVMPITWRTHARFQPRWRRVRGSAIAIVQVVLAATIAYTIASVVLGHPSPLLAATVAITSLGLARDARIGRVVETVSAMLIGIALAESLRLIFDTGPWQLALTLVLTMLLGRFLMPSPQFAISAAVQAAIAMALPAAPLPFLRLVDGALGGVFAIVVTALLPRNPMRTVARDGQDFFAEFGAAADRIVQGLQACSVAAADRGLDKARALDAPIEQWRAALESAVAISRLSPFLRARRAELARMERMQRSMDLASRNLRVVARRAAYVVRDGSSQNVAAGTLAQARRGADLLAASLADIEQEPVARAVLVDIAKSLDPAVVLENPTIGEINLIASMRPLVVDLLQAAGMSHDDAAVVLPRI